MYKRTSFLREVFWRKGVVVVGVIYALLQLPYNLIQWFVAPEYQARFQLIILARYFRWWVWVIIALVLIIGILIEGSYQVIRRRVEELAAKSALLSEWTNSDALHAKLLRFGMMGDRLFNTCNDIYAPLPAEEVSQWIKEVETFLQTKIPEPMREVYVQLFRQDARLLKPVGQWGEDPHTKPMREVYVQLFRQDARLLKPVGQWGEDPHTKLRTTVDSHRYQLKKIMIDIALMCSSRGVN
jgi:xanthosine utilization system XapX-like protein